MPINELNRGLASKNLRAKFHKNGSNILGAIAVSHLLAVLARWRAYKTTRECKIKAEESENVRQDVPDTVKWRRAARHYHAIIIIIITVVARSHDYVCPSVCLSGAEKATNGRAPRGPAWHSTRRTLSERPTAETWTWRPVAALSSSSYSRPRWQPCSPPTSSSTRPSSRRDVIWRARAETCWPCTTRARSTTAPSSTPGQFFVALPQVKVYGYARLRASRSSCLLLDEFLLRFSHTIFTQNLCCPSQSKNS